MAISEPVSTSHPPISLVRSKGPCANYGDALFWVGSKGLAQVFQLAELQGSRNRGQLDHLFALPHIGRRGAQCLLHSVPAELCLCSRVFLHPGHAKQQPESAQTRERAPQHLLSGFLKWKGKAVLSLAKEPRLRRVRKRIQHWAGGLFPVSLCLKAQRSRSFVLRIHQDLRFKEKQEPSLLAPSGVPMKYNQKKNLQRSRPFRVRRCPERAECLESGRNHTPTEFISVDMD
ncbi:uncharacterized protein LOC121463737 [Microtus oregoni]|uniref:uncharacterized protein LOC121463737 n=1 Tax=Microtus oregoni TaxID=111838 RepID=UPI001BB2657D|nr:uncharacterized protein LOC121463737 [Microtus oregoni]